MKLKILKEKKENNSLHFKLTGEMTVYSASKLKDVLFKELKSCPGISLDLTDVDEADTSGFQILLFLKREAGKAGKGFGITGMSSRLRNIFNLYNENV